MAQHKLEKKKKQKINQTTFLLCFIVLLRLQVIYLLNFDKMV